MKIFTTKRSVAATIVSVVTIVTMVASTTNASSVTAFSVGSASAAAATAAADAEAVVTPIITSSLSAPSATSTTMKYGDIVDHIVKSINEGVATTNDASTEVHPIMAQQLRTRESSNHRSLVSSNSQFQNECNKVATSVEQDSSITLVCDCFPSTYTLKCVSETICETNDSRTEGCINNDIEVCGVITTIVDYKVLPSKNQLAIDYVKLQVDYDDGTDIERFRVVTTTEDEDSSSSDDEDVTCETFMTYNGTEYRCNSCRTCSDEHIGESTTFEFDCTNIHSDLHASCRSKATTGVGTFELCFDEPLNPVQGKNSNGGSISFFGATMLTVGGIAFVLVAFMFCCSTSSTNQEAPKAKKKATAPVTTKTTSTSTQK